MDGLFIINLDSEININNADAKRREANFHVFVTPLFRSY
jgi:hypothetical protein